MHAAHCSTWGQLTVQPRQHFPCISLLAHWDNTLMLWNNAAFPVGSVLDWLTNSSGPASTETAVSFQACSALFKACRDTHLPFVSAFAAWEFPFSPARQTRCSQQALSSLFLTWASWNNSYWQGWFSTHGLTPFQIRSIRCQTSWSAACN